MINTDNENLRHEIGDILFRLGKDINIHKIDSANTIIDIPYKVYIDLIIEAAQKHC